MKIYKVCLILLRLLLRTTSAQLLTELGILIPPLSGILFFLFCLLLLLSCISFHFEPNGRIRYCVESFLYVLQIGASIFRWQRICMLFICVEEVQASLLCCYYFILDKFKTTNMCIIQSHAVKDPFFLNHFLRKTTNMQTLRLWYKMISNWLYRKDCLHISTKKRENKFKMKIAN